MMKRKAFSLLLTMALLATMPLVASCSSPPDSPGAWDANSAACFHRNMKAAGFQPSGKRSGFNKRAGADWDMFMYQKAGIIATAVTSNGRFMSFAIKGKPADAEFKKAFVIGYVAANICQFNDPILSGDSCVWLPEWLRNQLPLDLKLFWSHMSGWSAWYNYTFNIGIQPEKDGEVIMTVGCNNANWSAPPLSLDFS